MFVALAQYCFYCEKAGLEVQMVLSAGTAYSLSVERIKINKPYGPKNCVLILQCLQGITNRG